MLRFVTRRVGTSLGVLGVLTLLTFLLARVLPSDPAVVYAGPKARPDELARIREQLGMNESIVVQYFTYMRDLLTGDWGSSLATQAAGPGRARRPAAADAGADRRRR